MNKPRKKQTRITKEQTADLVAKAKDGYSNRQLAVLFNLDPSSVSHIRCRFGLPKLGRKIPEDQIPLIVKAHANGTTMTRLAAQYQVDLTAIAYILRKNGVPSKKNRRFTKGEQLDIANSYKRNESVPQLASRYGTSTTSILRVLHRQDVEIRSMVESHRKIPANYQAFVSACDNEEAAYWVGFLMADGCVTTPSRKQSSARIQLGLALKDYDHVALFRSFLKSGHAICISDSPNKIIKGEPTAFYAISSNELAASLAEYGVVPNKNNRETVHLLETNRHFFRGMVTAQWASTAASSTVMRL